MFPFVALASSWSTSTILNRISQTLQSLTNTPKINKIDGGIIHEKVTSEESESLGESSKEIDMITPIEQQF